jgi:hypothetical protein
MKQNRLKINAEYISDKIKFEKNAYDVLHPHLIDEGGNIWQMTKFTYNGFEAVRKLDRVESYFNPDGEIQHWDAGSDLEGTVLVRELTSYELSKYKDTDSVECFFRKEAPVYIMTARDRKLKKEREDAEPQYLKDLVKHMKENPISDEKMDELLGCHRTFTPHQIGNILDRILKYLDQADHSQYDDDQNVFIDDDALLYEKEDHMTKYGFTQKELCGSLNDLYLEAEDEGVLETNCSAHREEGFSFYHQGRRLQICQFVGQGSFYRLEILGELDA